MPGRGEGWSGPSEGGLGCVAVVAVAFLAVGVKTVVSTVRARAYGDHLTSQEPFLESNWFAPSGLIATRLERKVQHEFEHHPARRAELG